MLLVALSRARRSMTWYLCILGVGLVIDLIFGHSGHIIVNNREVTDTQGSIPLSAVAIVPMFLSAMYASAAGLSLNRENSTLEIAWTKPISRTALALKYIAVNAGAIIAAYAVAWVAVAVVLVRESFVLVPDAQLVPAVALSLGVALMWYALVLVLSAPLGKGGAAVAGYLWPVAFLALALHGVPGVFGLVMRAINVINPLAYFSGVTSNDDSTVGAHMTALSVLPLDERALIVWGFAIVFCAAATQVWSRREV